MVAAFKSVIIVGCGEYLHNVCVSNRLARTDSYSVQSKAQRERARAGDWGCLGWGSVPCNTYIIPPPKSHMIFSSSFASASMEGENSGVAGRLVTGVDVQCPGADVRGGGSGGGDVSSSSSSLLVVGCGRVCFEHAPDGLLVFVGQSNTVHLGMMLLLIYAVKGVGGYCGDVLLSVVLNNF